MKRIFTIVAMCFLLMAGGTSTVEAQKAKGIINLIKRVSKAKPKGSSRIRAPRRLLHHSSSSSIQAIDYSKSISGGFYYIENLTNIYGQSLPVYVFELDNVSSQTIRVSFTATNASTGEQAEGTVTLSPNERFSFGPDNGWYWLSGERAYVTFSNGQSFYWEL